jgi:hypothetical protein
MNIYFGLVSSGAPLMPEIVPDPPSASCYHLFPGTGIQEFQRLGPDPFVLCAPAARSALSLPGEI